MLEIFSIAISACAFLLSLYAAINTYYEKHIKTKFYLRWTYVVGEQLNICVLVSNMSSRPSTITNAFFKNEDEIAESSWFPVKLLSVSNPNTHKEKIALSDCTPLNISPRSSRTFIISFQNLRSNQIITDKLNFKFVVNSTEINQSLHPKVILKTNQLRFVLENRLKEI